MRRDKQINKTYFSIGEIILKWDLKRWLLLLLPLLKLLLRLIWCWLRELRLWRCSGRIFDWGEQSRRAILIPPSRRIIRSSIIGNCRWRAPAALRTEIKWHETLTRQDDLEQEKQDEFINKKYLCVPGAAFVAEAEVGVEMMELDLEAAHTEQAGLKNIFN